MDALVKPRYQLTLMAVIVLLLLGIGYRYHHVLHPSLWQPWMESLGVWGPVCFVLIYALATAACLPGLALTLAGGAVFGPYLGCLLNWLGAIIGASIAFFIARYGLSAVVQQHFLNDQTQAMMQGIREQGWRYVAAIRAMPVFPFNVVNYVLGLTSIRWDHYILATAVFILPFTWIYTYLGYLGLSALTGATGDWLRYGSIGLSLLVLLLVWPRLAKLIQNHRSQAARKESP